MNAETRAKEIVDDLASRVMAHGWEEDFHHPLLRQAEALISAVIIQAENDKLEEAERAILNEHSVAETAELNVGLLRAARAVKALRLSTPEKD